MNKPTSYGPASLRRLLPALTMIMGSEWEPPEDHTFDGIDVAAEYKLIQEKKSNLPKRMRDLIVKTYKNT